MAEHVIPLRVVESNHTDYPVGTHFNIMDSTGETVAKMLAGERLTLPFKSGEQIVCELLGPPLQLSDGWRTRGADKTL